MKRLICVMVLVLASCAGAVDIWMDVDVALAEVPINKTPLVDAGDGLTIENALTYNQAGLALYWNFVTTAGAMTSTAVTPTDPGTGVYDWVDQGDSGIYAIEIPASGGGTINNDTEGFGWFTGTCTAALPWSGPVIGFRDANLNNALIDSATTVDAVPANTTHVSATAQTANDNGADINSILAGTYSVSTTVATGNTTTSFTLTAGTAVADAYNDMIITITDADGNTSIESRRINDWTAGRVVTVDTAFSFTPAVGDVVVIRRDYVASELKAISTDAVGDVVAGLMAYDVSSEATADTIGLVLNKLRQMIDAVNRWTADSVVNVRGGRY